MIRLLPTTLYLSILFVSEALAHPISGTFENEPNQCSDITLTFVTDEIGPAPIFGDDDRATITCTEIAGISECNLAPDNQSDWSCDLTWHGSDLILDVFVVTDFGVGAFANWDGKINEFTSAKFITSSLQPGASVQFFLIDFGSSTVPPGFASLGLASQSLSSNLNIVGTIAPIAPNCPAVSEYGILVMFLGLITVGSVVVRGRLQPGSRDCST